MFDLRPNYGEGNEENGNLLKNIPCTQFCTQCPRPGSRPPLTCVSTGYSWTLTGKPESVSCGVTAPFSWVLVHTKFDYALQESVSQSCVLVVLCGINGDLLQEGLCHSQVCCTQSPYPCGRPLLTCTFLGDNETQFWLSLCGISGSWCAQGLFEPSECLWWVRGLILNTISPLSPSCWGFSFALGRGYLFLVGSNILQLTVVQQQVVTLEFS